MIKNLIRKQIKKTDIVKGLEEEKKELTNKVNQLQIENNNFKSQVNNFLESRETIKIEIADLIRQNKNLNDRVMNFFKSREAVQKEIAQIKTENKALKNKLKSFNNYKTENELLIVENDSLKKYIQLQKFDTDGDFSKLTIIIPYRKTDNSDRQMNEDITLRYLKTVGVQNIIVSEHSDGSNRKFFMDNYAHLFKSFEFIHINANGQLFNKAKAINSAVIQSKTPYITIHDLDCLAKKKNINMALVLLEIGFDVVHPFDKYITEIVDKEKFRKSYDFKSGILPELRTKADGGIVFFNKCSFISMGMANEYFSGWGGEDNEMVIRADICRLKRYRIDDTLYHLYHHRPKKRIKNNWDQIEKTLQYSNKLHCQNDVNKWPWVIEAKKSIIGTLNNF